MHGIAMEGEYLAGERIDGTSYRVVRQIGRGGMGIVFEVEHEALGRRFVMKVLHARLAKRKDLVARMQNEWRTLAQLDHPAIVNVTDAGTTAQGLPFYVMERLEGCTLAELLRTHGRLSPARASEIALDVLSGLGAAHAAGAVHRDVKPENVYVTPGGAKVLDFGIAKLRDKEAKVVTKSGVAIGTPRYMAPEQAQGARVDGRADVYAVGLLLYEAVAGRGPFAHVRDPNELVLAHIAEEPARLDLVDQGVPPHFADLVQRWLSKLPSSRPPTALVAAAELDAVLPTLKDHAAESADTTVVGVYEESTLGPASVTTGQGDAHRRENSDEGEATRVEVPSALREPAPPTGPCDASRTETMDVAAGELEPNSGGRRWASTRGFGTDELAQTGMALVASPAGGAEVASRQGEARGRGQAQVLADSRLAASAAIRTGWAGDSAGDAAPSSTRAWALPLVVMATAGLTFGVVYAVGAYWNGPSVDSSPEQAAITAAPTDHPVEEQGRPAPGTSSFGSPAGPIRTPAPAAASTSDRRGAADAVRAGDSPDTADSVGPTASPEVDTRSGVVPSSASSDTGSRPSVSGVVAPGASNPAAKSGQGATSPRTPPADKTELPAAAEPKGDNLAESDPALDEEPPPPLPGLPSSGLW